MPAIVFEVPDARAGTDWLAREGRARQADLLVALLSRFNHDLRTPLNTVVGWTHLLQQGLVDSARSRHVADVLARNTREQTTLLDEFVDDGRAVLGVLKLVPVPIGVDELIARALERAAPLASLHGVTFASPVDARDGAVRGDERRLPRLVYRLLAAAARRAREGAAVELTVARDGDTVSIGIDAPAAASDWSDAAMLDLRIASFVAAMHDGSLSIDTARDRAGVALRLPAGR
jgi:signal transduction histidine kinase